METPVLTAPAVLHDGACANPTDLPESKGVRGRVDRFEDIDMGRDWRCGRFLGAMSWTDPDKPCLDEYAAVAPVSRVYDADLTSFHTSSIPTLEHATYSRIREY